MDGEDKDFGENVSRLVQAGLGAGARLDPLTREKVRQRLKVELRSKPSAAGFPDYSLAVLAGVLAAMALSLGGRIVAPGVRVTTSAPLIMVAVILGLNLAMVPLAAIIIVRRRRHAQHA